MHPINKRNFGTKKGALAVKFHNGSAIVTGQIIKQVGTSRFRVATLDGSITKICALARTADELTALISGTGPQAAARASLCTIEVTKFVTGTSDPVENVARIFSTTLFTIQGTRLTWARAKSAQSVGAGTIAFHSYAPALPTILNATTTHTNWAVASGVTIATANYPVVSPSGRTAGLRISKPTSGTFGGARTAAVPANFKLSEVALVGLRLYWGADQGSVSIRFSSDAFATKRREFSWAYAGQLHKGWNELTIRPDDDGTTAPNGSAWVNTGSQAIDEVINGIQISISTSSGNAADVYLDGIFYHRAVPIKGAIRIGFDRFGETSIVEKALPLMQARSIKGYWAGDANLIDGDTNSRRLLQIVYNAGWDAISQGMYHPDYTVAGAARLGSDYDQARAIFDKQGFTRARNLFSYPLSANDVSTDAMLLSKGVQMARSGWPWWIHPTEFDAGPKLIGHGAVNLGGKTLAVAKKLVDSAVRYGVCIDLFCHGIAPGGTGTTPPADTLLWYESDFAALLDYAAAYRTQGLLDIETPSEWLDKHQTRPTRA